MTRLHTTDPRFHRLVRALRDMDYAQRRVFELRTGVSVTDPWERF